MASLLIVKHQGEADNFTCTFDTIGELFLSAGYWTILNGMFQIKELNGGTIQPIEFGEVTVRDDSSGTEGVPQSYGNENDLRNRLLELGFLRQRGEGARNLQELLDNSPQESGAVFVTIPIAFGTPNGTYSIISESEVSSTDSNGNTTAITSAGKLNVQTGGMQGSIAASNLTVADQQFELPDQAAAVTETLAIEP